jgi:hypothetical protein
MSDQDPTFYQWLSEQKPDFQNAAIGEKRAEQLRSGKLSERQFKALKLGKKFAPMTLEQMQASERLIFNDDQ